MSSFELLAVSFKDILPYPAWQIPGLILLIAIIVGWVMYRKRQM